MLKTLITLRIGNNVITSESCFDCYQLAPQDNPRLATQHNLFKPVSFTTISWANPS